MAFSIETDTALMNSTIAQMRDELASLRGSLDGVYNAVAELNTMWDGVGNDAFNTQFQTDRDFFIEVCAGIERIIDDMEYARSQYDSCEAQVSNIIAAIKI